MKRRQRKPILDINGEQADSTRRRWHNKYEQIADEHPEQNGVTKNPLFNLVGHYDSDSETDDKNNHLNDKVDDFLKEIQAIKPEKSTLEQSMNVNKNHNYEHQYEHTSKSTWQECYDESTGYPYYWHTETNEVTWEIPEELNTKKAIPQSEPLPHSQYMHWSTTKTYPQMQNNIPDGMIPKEVVARNRNRQVGNHQKIVTERQPAVIKKLPQPKDEDSDDGKIEMITSFGNDDSDSDSSSDDSVTKSPEKPKRKDTQAKRSHSNSLKTVPSCRGSPLQEDIISKGHGPEPKSSTVKGSRMDSSAKDSNETVPSEENRNFSSNNNSSTSKAALKRKIEIENNQTVDNKKRARETSTIKVSLVPGYEDDSENEEDSSQKQCTESKPLFPISNYYDAEKDGKTSKSEVISNEKLVKKVETRQTDSGCVRIFEYHASDGDKAASNDRDSDDKSNDNTDDTKTEVEELKNDQPDVKPNKFLDDLDTPAKAFQRKKRIAFDVIPNKAKTELQESSEPIAAPYTTAYENEEKFGLGFQDKNSEDSNKSPKETMTSMTKGSISFVKGETINMQKEESSMSDAKKIEFKALTDTTIEKLKFLSEGSSPASAVQVMAIQLQTLLNAWESKDLKEKYLCDWLTETSCELSRLEQTAAPPGWECQWDRSHKRYFYRNLSNDEMQWTYPETDVVGGTEEMELCTTPPPEQEETAVIEVNSTNSEHNVSHIQEENQRTSPDAHLKNIMVPPPPQISSPSPPPPPRIYAEDLKRDKKRKDEPEKTYENKKDKLEQADPINQKTTVNKTADNQLALQNQSSKTPGTLTTNEPLPPGVDSPDMSYSLPTSAMESTVLYTPASQQTNPIYAATLGNAAVPLIAHHTALMQGQLMHYPAYHPLHNQMIMATANRLAEQDTIQFMVAADYRIYESNQVIAKPPVKTTHKESICSAIDSFYNDIASIEQNNKMENEAAKKSSAEIVPSSTVQLQQTEAEKSPASIDLNVKEKKKKKTKVGISKKQKEVSSMVAKWQKVQKNFSD